MKKISKIILTVVGIFAIVPKIASAHCPLCTAGAGALAIFAASIGVSSVVIGILIGAFALALGLWISNVIKKTICPISKNNSYDSNIFINYCSINASYQALCSAVCFNLRRIEYGSLLHNTYAINLFLFGAVLGAIIMFVAKPISKLIVHINGGKLLFRRQGPIISFILLIIISVIFQFLFT